MRNWRLLDAVQPTRQEEVLWLLRKDDGYYWPKEEIITRAFKKVIELGCFSILRALQAAVNLDLNREDYLLLAVKYRQNTVLSELLELNADPHSFGAKALSVAAQEANVTATRILLGCERADFNSLFGSDGNNLLHRAISGTTESPKVVQLIIDSGNYTHAANKKGETPIGLAIATDREDFVDLLIKNVANIEMPCYWDGPRPATPLLYAAARNKEIIVRLLLQRGASLEAF